MSRDAPASTTMTAAPIPIPAVVRNINGDVMIGGSLQFTVPEATYLKMLGTSIKDKIPGRRLITKLLHHVYTQQELSTMNATGKTKEKASYPKLHSMGLIALFNQARLQFPMFTDHPADSSCETMKAINNICKKSRR